MSSITCMLCGKKIIGKPVTDAELIFDSLICKETYRKLAGVYGSNISDMGLPDVVNGNFFFMDIVGLSDPSLSVKKQISKIDVMNKIIGSCDAFLSTPKNKKIAFPTGDGMAIGFLLNPELPLQLSIQFHQKLREYNHDKLNDDAIGVRIGLSAGPVFVVRDINNNTNVWGPGLILARRVMDIGDNLHILIADRLAEQLIELRDEYKETIKPVSDYKIKHGQIIKVYSAHSEEFGNSALPEKIAEYIIRKNHTS